MLQMMTGEGFVRAGQFDAVMAVLGQDGFIRAGGDVIQTMLLRVAGLWWLVGGEGNHVAQKFGGGLDFERLLFRHADQA